MCPRNLRLLLSSGIWLCTRQENYAHLSLAILWTCDRCKHEARYPGTDMRVRPPREGISGVELRQQQLRHRHFQLQIETTYHIFLFQYLQLRLQPHHRQIRRILRYPFQAFLRQAASHHHIYQSPVQHHLPAPLNHSWCLSRTMAARPKASQSCATCLTISSLPSTFRCAPSSMPSAISAASEITFQ